MRSLLVVALGALLSTSAFAGHRQPPPRRPEPTMARATHAVTVVHVVGVAPPRPGLIWIAGHYEGRTWVSGHWEALRPTVGVAVTLPMVHVDLR